MIACIAMAAAAEPTRLALRDAMKLAVEQNPDRTSAALAEEIARIEARRARLDRVSATVTADGAADIGFEKRWGEDVAGVADANWEARATVSVPLYAGGSVRANIDQADASAAIAETDRVLTERTLVRSAYTAYWNIKAYELQIAAEEEGLALTRQSLDIITAKANAGLAAGIDVNRSQVGVYAQEASLVATRAARDQAEQELARLLHMPGADLELTDEPPEAATGAVHLDEDAGAARPELTRKDRELARAEAAVRLARAGTLPTIALNATTGLGANTAGYTASGVGPAFEADALAPTIDGSVGVSLGWDLFDLWQTRDAVAEAKLAARQVQAATDAERDAIAAEIRQAASAVEALRQRVPLLDAQVTLARENLQIVQGLYAQGSATLLDLLDAQTSFRQARTEGASLRVQLATAEDDLRWLLGEDLLGATP